MFKNIILTVSILTSFLSGLGAHAGKDELVELLSQTHGGIELGKREPSKWLFKRRIGIIQVDGQIKHIGDLTKVVGNEDVLNRLNYLDQDKRVNFDFQRTLTELLDEITINFNSIYHIQYNTENSGSPKIGYVLKITDIPQEDAIKIANTLSGDNAIVVIADELF